MLTALRAFRGLPFARRQLRQFRTDDVDAALRRLTATGALAGYAPLIEISGRKVAQTEHTIAVLPDGVEVLT